MCHGLGMALGGDTRGGEGGRSCGVGHWRVEEGTVGAVERRFGGIRKNL